MSLPGLRNATATSSKSKKTVPACERWSRAWADGFTPPMPLPENYPWGKPSSPIAMNGWSNEIAPA